MNGQYLLYLPDDEANCATRDYLHGFIYESETGEIRDVYVCACGKGHQGTVRLSDFDAKHIIRLKPEQVWPIEYAKLTVAKAKQWLRKRVTDCFPDDYPPFQLCISKTARRMPGGFFYYTIHA